MQHRRGLSEIRDMRVWLVRIAWNLALDRKRSVRPDQMDALFAGSLIGRGASAENVIEEAQAMQAVLL
jgi:RNA polymerase sigma-70 factor (ECF subfamily)